MPGIAFGLFTPTRGVREFTTFPGIFSAMLGFIIPLLIFGLVAPAVADPEKSSGKMPGITAGIAYGSTVVTGFATPNEQNKV